MMQEIATETSTTYRFNILERLTRHTEVKRLQIKQLVMLKSKCSKPTLDRVIYQTFADPRVPNYNVLKAFAEVFKVPMEELESPQP